MEKKNLLFTIGMISSVALGIALPLLSTRLGGSSYSSKDAKEWMRNIDDDRSLDTLSLPGTHESAAMNAKFDLTGKCQDVSIANQLRLGARVLDVHLRLYSNNFALYHKSFNLDLSFDSLIDQCKGFLDSYPSETIVLLISEEDEPYKSSLTFDEALRLKIKENSKYFYIDNEIPKLRQVRKRMSIVSMYDGSSLGISASSAYIQDYSLYDSLDDKKEKITSCLEYSSSLKEGGYTLNFFSGNLSSSLDKDNPIDSARIINPWSKEILKEYASTGIALFDFMDEGLAASIWRKNI